MKTYDYAVLAPVPWYEHARTIKGVFLDCGFNLLPAAIARYIDLVCRNMDNESPRRDYRLTFCVDAEYITAQLKLAGDDSNYPPITLSRDDLGKFLVLDLDKGSFYLWEAEKAKGAVCEMTNELGRLAEYRFKEPQVVFICIASVADNADARALLLTSLYRAGYAVAAKIEQKVDYVNRALSHVELTAFGVCNPPLKATGYVDDDEWIMFTDVDDRCEVDLIKNADGLKKAVAAYRGVSPRYGILHNGQYLLDWTLDMRDGEPVRFIIHEATDDDKMNEAAKK